MILQVAPDAPLIVRAGAATILWLHIGGGAGSLLSGFTAILARKGERLHRTAGTVFFICMLLVTVIGAATAPFLPQRLSSVVGVLTFYLVATSWATVRRREGSLGRFEVIAMVVALADAAVGFAMGWMGAAGPKGLIDDAPYQAAYVFSSIALLAGLLDLKVLLQGGVSGRARITRHLWRMCTALLIATLSFVGQPAAIPPAWRGSPLLFLPILLVAGLTLFWIIRARFTRAFESAAVSPPHSPRRLSKLGQAA